MIFEPNEEGKGLGLITSSGYKAGLISVVLPVEAGEKCICKDWLLKNWKKWVYPECEVSEVYVSVNYPEPEIQFKDDWGHP